MNTTCAPCGTTWAGLKAEHCTECHQTFTTTSNGDRHRVGPHWPAGQRRCLAPDELRAKGLHPNARGHWAQDGASPAAERHQGARP